VLKTSAEIAVMKGVSSQAANKFILKNGIEPSGMKGKYKTYDCTREPLAGYLADAVKTEPPPPSPTVTSDPDVTAEIPKAITEFIPKPLNDIFADKIPGKKASEILLSKAVQYAMEHKDVAALARLGQYADKKEMDEILYRQTMETERAKEAIARGRAERIRLENEIRRGEYMEKAAVKMIFGRQYAVDTSVLHPLGLKLADMIDALPPGPDRRGKVQKLIDDEIFSALESKKRILIEYIEIDDEPA